MSNESIRHDAVSRLTRLKPVLLKRNKLISAIRDFFSQRSFVELETPIILDAPMPEPNIEAISAEKGILRTSHEPYLKACLAAGYDKIFEIGACFRKEEKGRLHREEFTMLEYYQKNASSDTLIPLTKQLITHCALAVNNSTIINYNGKSIQLDSEWELISLKDAFAKFAGYSVGESIANNKFEVDMVEKIEPNFPENKPCIVRDYPEKFRAYSKLRDETAATADRWELYIGGIEIANTYTELTDKCEIRKLINNFREQRRKSKMKDYPCCEVFMQAVDVGIPPSAGTAMGIDRLLILLTSSKSIEEVKI